MCFLGYNSTYFSNKFKKVKHATPRNKWSVCWSSSSITYVSPLEGHCFSRSSAYQWVRIVPLFSPIYFNTHMSRSFFKSLLKIRRFMKLEPLISHIGILYQVRVITVFTVFRLLTDFVGLYNYEFWLSLCKIVRSSVILLLPLFTVTSTVDNSSVLVENRLLRAQRLVQIPFCSQWIHS